MAIPRTFRLLFLSLLFPSLSVLAAVPNGPSPSASWFDQRLSLDIVSLTLHASGHDQRSTLVAIALLDEIYQLRENVSDPTTADSTLIGIAKDERIHPALRAEAEYLSKSIKDGGDGANRPNDPAEVLVRTTLQSLNTEDVESIDAAVEINTVHQWSNTDAQTTAELTNSADAWYRASRIAGDGYHQALDLQRTLALDGGYVPAALAAARQYLAEGRPTQARNVLTRVLEKYPDEPSVEALLAEMEMNQGHASAALKILDRLRSKQISAAVARHAASSYAQLGFLSDARELAQRAFKLHPAGIEERQLVLHLQQEAGEAQTSVSDYRVAKSKRQPDAEDAEIPAASDGDSERLRRLLQGKAAPPVDHSQDFFVNVADFAGKWRALSPSERNQSRLLADIRVDQLRNDYQVVQHVQQLIAIGAAADLGTYRTRTVQYAPQSQEIRLLKARVHHSDGRTVDAEDMGESSVADASLAMYYDLRARQLRFRDLGVGDVIELEYTLSPLQKVNPYGNYFAELVAFGGSLPCDLQRYVLLSPTAVRLNSFQHLLSQPAITQNGQSRTFVWEKQNIAPLDREARSPSWSEQGAYVHVSNFDSWEDVGKWYADLIRPQFKPTAELEEIARQIVEQHPNRLDRVAAIDDFVLKSTRYVALEFGVYGFKPYPVAETLARKFGDCKDKSSLMIALLRAAGIDAEIALVRTKHLGEIPLQPASASIFDHAIVYVPEFDLWLDGTAEYSRLRELPVEDQGVMALTVTSDGNAVLRRTPQSGPADNYSRRTIDARIDRDGTIHFSGATYVRGEDAPELRRQLEPRDAKLDYVRERLAQVLPAVEVRNVEAPASPVEAVALNFTGDLGSFRGRHEATLPSSWMERNYVAALAAGNSRTQDLVLDAPWTTEEEIHIQLPEGARVAGLPAKQAILTEFGKGTIEYRLDEREITVLSEVSFSKTRVPSSRYAAFREFTHDLEEAFRRDIDVVLP